MPGYGIDLSHWQAPASLPWRQFEGTVDAVIVRATYGAELRDRSTAEHVRRAREIGAKVGLYTFFRPIHSVQKQVDLFRSVADAVGTVEGDIVPALDIEADPFPAPGVPVAPAWSGPVYDFAERLRELYSDCIVYITQREWGQLGQPQWVLDRPLWVAHYTGASKPASPGDRTPFMWQHRVGPFVPNGPGGYDKAHPELDQNRILGPLPLIARKPSAATDVVEAQDSNDESWDELRERVALQQFDWHALLEDPPDPEPIA